MDTEETQFWKDLDRCRTRKCSKIIKNVQKERNFFEKEQTKKCPQKRAKAFYDCSSKFYERSKLKILSKKLVKCTKKKCHNQQNKLTTYRNKKNKMLI